MKDRISLMRKSLEDNSKLFLEVNTDILDFNSQLDIVLNKLKEDKEDNIMRSKLCVLTKYYIVNNNGVIKDELKGLEDTFNIKISPAEYNKRVNCNEIFIDCFKNNRRLFEVYRNIIFKLNYKITTLSDIIAFFDSNNIIENVGIDTLEEIVDYHINNPKDTQSVATSILKKSTVSKICPCCNKMQHISNYIIGKPYCKSCSKNKNKSDENVDEAVKEKDKKPKINRRELEESIKEFKNNSADAEMKPKVAHSVNYVMLNSALNTIDMHVNSLSGIDINGLSYDESLDINIKIVELNKKLLNLEGEIYAKQKLCTE